MYFISDWALLNDTKSKQLQRILAEFHHLNEVEIYLACTLLESYHAVYRRSRLEQRRNLLKLEQARNPRECLPPTVMQLHEIAQRINTKAALRLKAEDVLINLQNLAKRLRQYRIYVRKSLRKTAPTQEQQNLPICDSEALTSQGTWERYSARLRLQSMVHKQQSVDRIQLSDFMNSWDNHNELQELLVLNYTKTSDSEYELTQIKKTDAVVADNSISLA